MADEATLKIILQDTTSAAAHPGDTGAGGSAGASGGRGGPPQTMSIVTDQFRSISNYLKELPEIRRAVGRIVDDLANTRQSRSQAAVERPSSAGMGDDPSSYLDKLVNLGQKTLTSIEGLKRIAERGAGVFSQATLPQATPVAARPVPVALTAPPTAAPAATPAIFDDVVKVLRELRPPTPAHAPPELTEVEAAGVGGMQMKHIADALKLEIDASNRPRGAVGGPFGQAAIDFEAAMFAGGMKFREGVEGIENEGERQQRAEDFWQTFFDASEGKKPPEPVWNPAWLGAGQQQYGMPGGPEAVPFNPKKTILQPRVVGKHTLVPPSATPGKPTVIMPQTPPPTPPPEPPFEPPPEPPPTAPHAPTAQAITGPYPGAPVAIPLGMPVPVLPPEVTGPPEGPPPQPPTGQYTPPPPSTPPTPPPAPPEPPIPIEHPDWATWDQPHHGPGWNLRANVPAEDWQRMVEMGVIPSVHSNAISTREYERYRDLAWLGGHPPPGFAHGGWVGGAAHMAEGGGLSAGVRKKLQDMATHPDYFNPEWLTLNTDAALRKAQDEAVSRGFTPEQASVVGHAVADYVHEHGTNLNTVYKRALLRAKDAGASDEKALDVARNVMDYHIAQRGKGRARGGAVYAAEGGLMPDDPRVISTAAMLQMPPSLFADVAGKAISKMKGSGEISDLGLDSMIWDLIDSWPAAFAAISGHEDQIGEYDKIKRRIVETFATPQDAEDVDWRPSEMLPEDYYMYARGGKAGHPGKPQGTDTIPAWLSPGEFVVNAEDAAKHRDALEAINSGAAHMAEGGMTPEDAAKALASVEPTPGMGGDVEGLVAPHRGPSDDQLASAIEKYSDSLVQNELTDLVSKGKQVNALFDNWTDEMSKVVNSTEELWSVVDTAGWSVKDLEELFAARKKKAEDEIPVGVEIPNQKSLSFSGGMTKGDLESFGKMSKVIGGVAKGDFATVLGEVGGPAGAAAAGPAGAAKAALDAVNSAVLGGIKSVAGTVSDIANAIADPSADPSVPLAKIGDAASKAGESLANVSPALGWMVTAIGESTKALAGFMQVLDKTVERYGDYSPEIAQAQAMAEVRQTIGDLRRSSEVSGEMVKYIEARSDMQQKFEDIKVKLLVKIIPIATRAIEILEAIMPSGEGITGAITELLGPLAAIPKALGIVSDTIKDESRPPPDDPTTSLFRPPTHYTGMQLPES